MLSYFLSHPNVHVIPKWKTFATTTILTQRIVDSERYIPRARLCLPIMHLYTRTDQPLNRSVLFVVPLVSSSVEREREGRAHIHLLLLLLLIFHLFLRDTPYMSTCRCHCSSTDVNWTMVSARGRIRRSRPLSRPVHANINFHPQPIQYSSKGQNYRMK